MFIMQSQSLLIMMFLVLANIIFKRYIFLPYLLPCFARNVTLICNFFVNVFSNSRVKDHWLTSFEIQLTNIDQLKDNLLREKIAFFRAFAQMMWIRPRFATPNFHQMRKTRQHLDKLPSLHTESTKLQLLRILLQVMSYLSMLVCGRDT